MEHEIFGIIPPSIIPQNMLEYQLDNSKEDSTVCLKPQIAGGSLLKGQYLTDGEFLDVDSKTKIKAKGIGESEAKLEHSQNFDAVNEPGIIEYILEVKGATKGTAILDQFNKSLIIREVDFLGKATEQIIASSERIVKDSKGNNKLVRVYPVNQKITKNHVVLLELVSEISVNVKEIRA